MNPALVAKLLPMIAEHASELLPLLRQEEKTAQQQEVLLLRKARKSLEQAEDDMARALEERARAERRHAWAEQTANPDKKKKFLFEAATAESHHKRFFDLAEHRKAEAYELLAVLGQIKA